METLNQSRAVKSSWFSSSLLLRGAVSLLCAITILLAGFQSQSAGGPASEQKVDQNADVVVGVGDLSLLLDPQIQISGNFDSYKRAAFDGLTSINGKGDLEPGLAVSWRNVTPTIWEFKLRPGVKFWNGDPFTAKDVVFAIRRILDPATKSLVLTRIPTVRVAAAVGDLTVQIATSEPDPILPRRLSVVYIVDADVFQKAAQGSPLTRFVGTGPFKVGDFQTGQRLVLERVGTSWRGKPSAAKITLLAMPEVSTRVAALRSGQIDVITQLPADQIAPLQSQGFDIAHGLAGRTCILVMNSRYGGPLGNRVVRVALNYAIDKQALVENIFHGTAAVPQGQLVGPDGFGHDSKVKAYPYDPQRAKALLAQAGYPNGFRQKFVGSIGYFLNDQVIEQALIGMLSNVGVKAELAIEESALWHANNDNGQHKDMLFTCIQYFPVMDADFTLVLFDTRHPYKWYNNPEYDKVFEESRVTLDARARLQKLHRAIEVLHDDPPAVFLYQEPTILGFSRRIKDVEARPDQVLWFDPIKKLQ